jgi:membrane-associated phospholipid phosphatase
MSRRRSIVTAAILLQACSEGTDLPSPAELARQTRAQIEPMTGIPPASLPMPPAIWRRGGDPWPHAPQRPSAAPAESEPSAGSWKPILLESPSAVPLGPPAADTGRELQELKDRAARRTAAEERLAAYWLAGGVARWNELTRRMLARQQINSSHAARLFALLAVAQYDALVTTWHYKYLYKRPAPAAQDGFRPLPLGAIERYSYPSEHAAVAAASAAILRIYEFRGQQELLERAQAEHGEAVLWSGSAYPGDVAAGVAIGNAVAERVKKWAEQDGSLDAAKGQVPRQPEKWWQEQQFLPGWGGVKTWLGKTGAELRAPAPPPLDSDDFRRALGEIRAFSDNPTVEQRWTAEYWNAPVGGISLPGMWDQLALDTFRQQGFSEPRTARGLALTNVAMMDASIACWETKYHYLVPRPSMVDSQIKLPLGLPPHPSYPSGHSAISGAASGVLAYLVPSSAEEVHALAEDASASRFYGGIHYRFDGDEGLKQGRAVAALAVARGRKDGSPAR